MQRTTYNTKQKQIIFEFMLENKEKLLTCDEIGDALKNSGTPVGKATLYRFLDALVSSGDARKLSDDNKKSAAYQLLDKGMNCAGHMHLKCTQCGELQHLGCEFMHSVGEHIFNHHNFKIDNAKTVIYGICNKCTVKAGV